MQDRNTKAPQEGSRREAGLSGRTIPLLALLFLLLFTIALTLRACGRQRVPATSEAAEGSRVTGETKTTEQAEAGTPAGTAASTAVSTAVSTETVTAEETEASQSTEKTSRPETTRAVQAETAASVPVTTAAPTRPPETRPAETAQTPAETGSAESRAAGYVPDSTLTAQLQQYFYTDSSNNTDPDSPSRAMTASYKATLDALAERWYRGELSDAAVLSAMEQETFRWPDSAIVYDAHFQKGHAQVYELAGRDMQEAYDRIRMGNFSARHYVFLRTLYDASLDRCRIYLINGMIW